MGSMAVLTHTDSLVQELQSLPLKVEGGAGDTKIVWDKNNADEVQSARETFDRLRGKGFSAFAVTRTGGKGTMISEFDPDAEKIILAPRFAGG
jgi:hypothetical protein